MLFVTNLIRELFRLDTSRLEREVASLAVQQSSSASMLSESQEKQTAQLQHSINQLQNVFSDKIAKLDQSPEMQSHDFVASLIESSMRETISHAVTRVVKESLSGVRLLPGPDSQIKSTGGNHLPIRTRSENRELPYHENHQTLELQPTSDDRSTCALKKSSRQGPRNRSHKSKQRLEKFCRRYNTLIGIVFVQVFDVVSKCGDECGQSTDPAKDQELIFEFSFVPRAWLFHRGAFFTALWKHQHPESQISLQLRSPSIVSRDSAIFRACEAHDFKAMKMLFDQGKATPYDMTDSGKTLLWVSQHTKSKLASETDCLSSGQWIH